MLELIIIVLFILFVTGTLFALPSPVGFGGIIFWGIIFFIIWRVLKKKNQV